MKILEITSSKYNYNNNANSRLKDSYDLTEAPANPTPNYGSKNTSYGNINYKTKAPGAKTAVPLGQASKATAAGAAPATSLMKRATSPTAQQAVKKLSWLKNMGHALTVLTVIQYWKFIITLEEEYNYYIDQLNKGVDPNSIELKYVPEFKGKTAQDAFDLAERMRNKYRGEAYAAVLLNFSSYTTLLTILQNLLSLVKLGWLVTPIKAVVSRIEKNPALKTAILSYLSLGPDTAARRTVDEFINKLLGPVQPVMSDIGNIMQSMSDTIGDSIASLAKGLLDTVAGIAGIKWDSDKSILSSKIKPPDGEENKKEVAKQQASKVDPNYIKSQTGNVVIIGNQKVTDENGYLLPGAESIIVQAREAAADANLPDPYPNSKIKLNPEWGKYYELWRLE